MTRRAADAATTTTAPALAANSNGAAQIVATPDAAPVSKGPEIGKLVYWLQSHILSCISSSVE
jgi:hypothetical protein